MFSIEQKLQDVNNAPLFIDRVLNGKVTVHTNSHLQMHVLQVKSRFSEDKRLGCQTIPRQ
jgi:hypothetical protein